MVFVWGGQERKDGTGMTSDDTGNEEVTAWVEEVREPTTEETERIDRMIEEVLAEELGRPLRSPTDTDLQK